MNKSIISVVLGLIVIVLCIFLYGLHNEVKTLKQEKHSLKTNLEISKTAIVYYKDKHYKDVAQKQVMVVKNTDLENQLEILGFDKAKLKEKVKNLENLTTYWQGVAQMSGKIDTVYRDTIIYVNNKPQTEKTLNWSNNFLSLKQLYYPETNKLTIDYSYRTGMDLTIYNKSKGFLKGKELVCDVAFTDQNLKLTKSDVVINDKTKNKLFYETTLFKIGVGIAIGNLILK